MKTEYVDKRALLNYLKQRREAFKYTDMPFREVYEEIKAFPEAKAPWGDKSGWINVKDRLPEKGQTCLLFTHWSIPYMVMVGTYMPFPDDDKPVFQPGGMDIERTVKYWMPAPDAPEGVFDE